MSEARSLEAPDLDTAAGVQELYARLKALLGRDDLPPGVRVNLEQALSGVSLAMNNLGLEYEPLYELGV